MKPYFLLASGLAFGCAAHSATEPDAGKPYEYSHTVGGLNPEQCLELRSTCGDVVLLCDGADGYSRACPDVGGKSTDVYALPGADSAPNRPFGVASCVELEPCGASTE